MTGARRDTCEHKPCLAFDACLYGDHAGATTRPSSAGAWEKPRSVAELLDEAVKLRNLIYYAAPANSDLERDANRLGRVLYLLREETNRGE